MLYTSQPESTPHLPLRCEKHFTPGSPILGGTPNLVSVGP